MNILVAGSSSYLGRKTINILLDKGHSLFCLERNIIMKESSGRIQYYSSDKYKKVIDECEIDCFINFVGKYERVGVSFEDIIEGNLIYPLKILTYVIENDIRKIININTALTSGFNLYSFSKQKLSEFGKWFCNKKKYEKKFIGFYNILLENFYGEDEPSDRFLPYVINRLKQNDDIDLTEGIQKRDFIYIEDVVSCLVKLLDIDIYEYIDIPLGTGEAPRIREVVEYLKDITNSKSKLNFGAIQKRVGEPDSVADISVLRDLGIQIKTEWKDGMKKLFEKV